MFSISGTHDPIENFLKTNFSIAAFSRLILRYYFQNSNNLNYGSVFFEIFSHVLKSICSDDFVHAKSGSGAKKRVVLRRSLLSRLRKRCMNKNSLFR